MRPSSLASFVASFALTVGCAGSAPALVDGVFVDGLDALLEASFETLPLPASIELVQRSTCGFRLLPGVSVSFLPEPSGAVRHEAGRLATWLRLVDRLHVEATTTRRIASLRPGGCVSAPVTIPRVRVDGVPPPGHRAPGRGPLSPGLWRASLPGARSQLPLAADFAGAPCVPVTQVGSQSEGAGALAFTGFMAVDKLDHYTLTRGSDDGSVIELAGQTLVSNEGQHPNQEKRAEVLIPAGVWAFGLRHFDAGGAHRLNLSIESSSAWRFLRERS